MEFASLPSKTFTAIWQSEQYYEQRFLTRLFEPYIARHVVDGKHEISLDSSILFDAFIYANDPYYYASFRGKNAFLVQLGDENYELGVDRYVHFRGVFRTIWSSVFNPKHVMVLPLGFTTVNSANAMLPASNRRFAWSFVGEAGKASRPDMVRAMSTIEPHMCFSSTPVRGLTFFTRDSFGDKRIPQKDFGQILGQSAFAPAPMGNASLESPRIYDALENGAIPIVERRLALDYFRDFLGSHPLPTVRSWSQARRLVDQLLNDPVKLDGLQQTCIQWWINYQMELTEKIGGFLLERSTAQDEVIPLKSRLPRWPFWQYFELLRHHSPRALSRRVGRQLARLKNEKKWRIAQTELKKDDRQGNSTSRPE